MSDPDLAGGIHVPLFRLFCLVLSPLLWAGKLIFSRYGSQGIGNLVSRLLYLLQFGATIMGKSLPSSVPPCLTIL